MVSPPKTNAGIPRIKKQKCLLVIGLSALAFALVLASVAAYLIISQKLVSSQGTQDTQDTQGSQESQGIQGTQDTQGTQGTQFSYFFIK